MTWLVLGLVLFLGAHSVQVLAPGLRTGALQRLGPGPWKGLYTLVSLVGFGLIIFGYGQARGGAPLYVLPRSLMHLTFALVWAGFVCVTAAYWPRNHLKRWLGDPMVFGVGLWALGHLLANAGPAAVVLFGAFLVWAVVDYLSLRRRAGAAATPAPEASLVNTGLTVVIGSILAAVFALWLHRLLIGVSPLG